ncbi:MAG TPA: hypothetical protein VFP72_16775 [Kineosporiaceae bacterium]|nr:hypothetical protein [Kineosporiaceae bacterium]
MSGIPGATLAAAEPAVPRVLTPAVPVPVAVPGTPAAPEPLFSTQRLWDLLAWALEVRRRPALLLEALRRPAVLAAVVAAAASIAVMITLPPVGADVAAQEFRAWLFRTHGPLLWQNQWYGGHLVLGYSVVYPAFAAVVGVRVLGLLACVWGAAAAGALLRHRLAALWFAAAFVGQFVQGQYPFALGVSFGLTALLAARQGRRSVAAVCAVLASLSSPLAGAFVLLLAVAWWTQAGWRRTYPLAASGVGVCFGWLLGGGGWFPFPGISLLTVLGFCAGGLWLVRPLPRPVLWGLLMYAAASLVVFSYPNAVGGNIARLGALAGGPLAALVFDRIARRRVLVLVAVPLVVWQAWPSVGAVLNGVGDPSSRASYYTGLRAFLHTQNPAAGRLEVPSLRQHWEASFVAEAFPVARGWERQLDLRNNSAVYRPDLTADQLHTWLRESGVVLVALPDAPLDPWARQEAELIATGQPWLVPVWHDDHWRVFRVADPAGMATGSAKLSKVGIDTLTLVAARRGDTVVRVRWSPYWRVASGPACVGADPDGWLLVRASEPGKVVISARSPLNPLTADQSTVCAPPPVQPAGVRGRATPI